MDELNIIYEDKSENLMFIIYLQFFFDNIDIILNQFIEYFMKNCSTCKKNNLKIYFMNENK